MDQFVFLDWCYMQLYYIYIYIYIYAHMFATCCCFCISNFDYLPANLVCCRFVFLHQKYVFPSVVMARNWAGNPFGISDTKCSDSKECSTPIPVHTNFDDHEPHYWCHINSINMTGAKMQGCIEILIYIT